MGAVDPVGVRLLATQLDEVSAELDDLVRAANRLNASWAMDRSYAVATWAQGHATRLRTSARIVEELDGRKVDWATTLAMYGLPSDFSAMPAGQGEADLQRLEEVLAGLPDVAGAAQRADAVAAFFATLSPTDQAYLVAFHPETVGNLDGVPNRLRYAANRLTIEATQQEENDRFTGWQPPPAKSDPTFVQWQQLKDRLDRYQEFLASEKHVVVQPDGSRATVETGRSFLMFTAPVWQNGRVVEDGRVAEVRGDLDTATHIGVMVPGITNRIDNFNGLVAGADNLRAQFPDPASTAVLVWLGYDTPEFQEMVPTTRAEQGAPALISTVEGMRRSAGSDVTLIAHSYGTVLAGQALQAGLRPDRVLLFGSPGLGKDIHSTADLGLPPGYPIYAMRAPGDWVSYSEGHGDDPAEMPGVTRLDTGWAGSGSGGTVQSHGHSEYYLPGSGGLHNIAAVLVGDQATMVRGGDNIYDEQFGGHTVRTLSNALPGIIPEDKQYAVLGDLEPVLEQKMHGEISDSQFYGTIEVVLKKHGVYSAMPKILAVAAAGAADEVEYRGGTFVSAKAQQVGAAADDALTEVGERAVEVGGDVVDGAGNVIDGAGNVIDGAGKALDDTVFPFLEGGWPRL